MIERRETRQIHVGSVPVGGGSEVTVQSMTTTKTADVDGTLAQVYALAGAGADIVRITCNDVAAAQGPLAELAMQSIDPMVSFRPLANSAPLFSVVFIFQLPAINNLRDILILL